MEHLLYNALIDPATNRACVQLGLNILIKFEIEYLFAKITHLPSKEKDLLDIIGSIFVKYSRKPLKSRIRPFLSNTAIVLI